MREKEPTAHPAERQPLMNKLEPSHHNMERSAWSSEGRKWSQSGRGIVDMIVDFLRTIFT